MKCYNFHQTNAHDLCYMYARTALWQHNGVTFNFVCFLNLEVLNHESFKYIIAIFLHVVVVSLSTRPRPRPHLLVKIMYYMKFQTYS